MLVVMTRIYTRGGDDGDTSLFGGRRVRKSDLRVEAYGVADEVSSAIGAARALLGPDSALDGRLGEIQRDLFRLGGALADSKGAPPVAPPGDAETGALERAIDRLEEGLPPLDRFILPGGSAAGAMLHLARAVCRRAERAVVRLADAGEEVPPGSVAYLNRLSHFLFVAARAANHAAGLSEETWKEER